MVRKHKHQWRKTASILTREGILKVTKKKCIICGEEKLYDS